MKASRRAFLKGTVSAAAITVSGGLTKIAFGDTQALAAGPGNKWPGRVAINFNKNAATATTYDTVVIKKMMDDTIIALTDQTTVGAAWKAAFPASLTASSKIAIKVPLGCADKNVAPHWSSVQAITEGLQQMDFGGSKIPAASITIYEMNCSDNFANFSYNATNFPGIRILRDSYGSNFTDGAVRTGQTAPLQYATSLQAASFLINVFRPGGHDTYIEGFTLGFKNHFGTYNPNHGDGISNSMQYLRDINSKGVVYNKNVLSICVGIKGAQEASGQPGSGPISYTTYARTIDSTISAASAVPPNTIIMSTDPVSAEMQTIKMMRLNATPTGGYAVNDMPKYLRSSAGVTGVLTDATYNIGVINESQMDVRRIVNGTRQTTASRSGISQSYFGGADITATQSKACGRMAIAYRLPADQIGKDAVIEIYDSKGSLVQRLSHTVTTSPGNLGWDLRAGTGASVGKGTYFLRLTCNGIQAAISCVVR